MSVQQLNTVFETDERSPQLKYAGKVKPTVQHPRYSKEKLARRRAEIYESQVRSPFKADNHGKIGAIALKATAFKVVNETLWLPCFHLRYDRRNF